MIGKWIALFLIGGASLFGAPQSESLALQEVRLSLENMTYQINHHKVDLELIQERLRHLESADGSDTPKTGSGVEKRLAALEKAHDVLISDLKTLKNHLNETIASLTHCESKMARLEEGLLTDLKTLKSSLQSIIGGQAGQYVVKPGDSLGQIALEHKTDVKTLKQLNELPNDRIYPGQKLNLP